MSRGDGAVPRILRASFLGPLAASRGHNERAETSQSEHCQPEVAALPAPPVKQNAALIRCSYERAAFSR